MTFLPIVERELRVAARRPGTVWTRVAAAVGALTVMAFCLSVNVGQNSGTIGAGMFYGLAWLAMIHCISVGVRTTADSLSEEKREGTLGLLFLTDLRGHDVVLGKLFATSLNAFYGLLAIFPVLAVPLLMGGLARDEVLRAVLVLLNTFLCSLAVGLAVSSLTRQARRAMGLTSAVRLLFGLGALVVGALLVENEVKWGKYLTVLSPFSGLILVPAAAYRSDPGVFWASVAWEQALFWLTFLFACWRTPRSWQDRPVVARGGWWRAWSRGWIFGPAAGRAGYRARLLDVNAYYWLAARERSKPAHVWAVLGGLAGLWFWADRYWGHDWRNAGVYCITGLCLHGILKFWVAAEAGKRLGEDRQAGALELVLATPLSVTEILAGQWRALARQFLPPLVAVLIIDLFLLGGMEHEVHDADHWGLWWVGTLSLILDLAALPWVAMWLAVSLRSPKGAAGSAVVRVLVIPWVAHVGTLLLMELVTNGQFNASSGVLFGLWLGWGVAADLVFGIAAYRGLHSRFRVLAMERYTPRPGIWQRLWSFWDSLTDTKGTP